MHAAKGARALHTSSARQLSCQEEAEQVKIAVGLSRLRCYRFVLVDTMLKTAEFSTAIRRYMYCAIDEAGSHVGSKSFRLVVGVYSQTGKDLLGSACSQPIRVMANNDIPHGAAHIPLVVHVR